MTTPLNHEQLAVEAARKWVHPHCSNYSISSYIIEAFIAGAAWQKALDRRAESGEKPGENKA